MRRGRKFVGRRWESLGMNFVGEVVGRRSAAVLLTPLGGSPGVCVAAVAAARLKHQFAVHGTGN